MKILNSLISADSNGATKQKELLEATTNSAILTLHTLAMAMLPISGQLESVQPAVWNDRKATWKEQEGNGSITLSLTGSKQTGVDVSCDVHSGEKIDSTLVLRWKQPKNDRFSGKFGTASDHIYPKRLEVSGVFINWPYEINKEKNTIPADEVMNDQRSLARCVWVRGQNVQIAQNVVGLMEHAAKSAGGATMEEGLQNLFNGLIESMAQK